MGAILASNGILTDSGIKSTDLDFYNDDPTLTDGRSRAFLEGYYVDATNGSDNKDGRAPGTAWQTIGKVNGESFVPDDRILSKRGETWVGRIWPTDSGSAGKPIVFGAYGSGAKPVIDGTGQNDSFLLNAVSHITVQDMQLQDADGGGAGYGIRLTGACSNITLSRLDCLNTLAEGVFLNGATNCTVRDCTATGCLVGMQFWGTSHDCVVQGGSYYSNDEEGLNVENSSYNITVRDVVCYSNGKAGFDTSDSVSDIIYQRCLSYSNGTVTPASGNGFNALDATTIEYQNCISRDNAAHGIEIQADSDDANVYHCTFNDNAYRNISLRGTNITVENNIVYDCGWNQQIGIYSGATYTSIDNNLYYRTAGADFLAWLDPTQYVGLPNWRTAISDEANSIFDDPDFVDLGGNDFHLQSSSPAIGEGATGTGVTDDYDGVTRGSPPDIGAYEYIG